MRNDLVSVIVPTYNRSYCLPRALDSALTQTHPNVEIVVVDDGSTDGTREMVRARYGHEARVRYVYQANQGVSAARNSALAMAEGDYIAFLDSDDFWMPWKLELQVACMEHAPEIGMIWTDMQAVDMEGEILYPRYLRTMYSAWRWFTTDQLFTQTYDLEGCRSVPFLQRCVGEEPDSPEGSVSGVDASAASHRELPVSILLHTGDVYSAMIMGNLVHTSTVLLRKERAKKAGKFDVKFLNIGEDYDFHLRTCREGPVGFIDLPSIQYRTGMADQLTRPEHSLEGATNFLTVITRELQWERSRITLSDRMIKAVLAEAHNWVGYQLIVHSRIGEARTHFLRALQYQPLQPCTLKYLTVSLLPGNTLPLLRKFLRMMGKSRRPSTAP